VAPRYGLANTDLVSLPFSNLTRGLKGLKLNRDVSACYHLAIWRNDGTVILGYWAACKILFYYSSSICSLSLDNVLITLSL
jgi:hypothetical protein